MSKKDVFGIGNALLDTLVFVEDSFLKEQNIDKGIMTLIDEEKQKELLSKLEGHKKQLQSGGSAANTMHGIALCGGTGIYAGKVSLDANGKHYMEDLQKAGISLEAKAADPSEGLTGACTVLISPDGERSMMTYLGISSTLSSSDFKLEDIATCKILYVEGYMWDGEAQKKACRDAMKYARENGVKVSMTFSDPFCVNRAHHEFVDLVKNELDIVFCNSEEVLAYAKSDNLESALETFKKDVKSAFVTHSDQGAYVIDNGKIELVPGFPVKVLDTTGAGDAFAAGALYGLAHGKTYAQAARLGNYLGSRIVQIEGARLTKEHLVGLNDVLSEK